MSVFKVTQGDGPVILAYPHSGTLVPEEITTRFNAEGRLLRDTDWHLPTLYDGLLAGATHVEATFHRYVIDANRGPEDESLYPGQNTTGLCPAVRFSGEPVYAEGQAPSPDEIDARVEQYWRPYHQALRGELDRLHAAA